MEASNGNGNGRGVTYAEARRMARWLNAFTPRELAQALRVHEAVGERFVKAMLWPNHAGGSVIEDTGIELEGPEGTERLYEVVPLPPDEEHRPKHTPPHIAAVHEMFGGLLLYDLRGRPVRIRTERQLRIAMSTPGSRQLHVNREREYQRQLAARREAVRKAERKRIAESQGKRPVEVD